MSTWEENWVVFLLDTWQSGKSTKDTADLMTAKFRQKFTKNQIAGMLKRLRDRFGTEDVDGDRYEAN